MNFATTIKIMKIYTDLQKNNKFKSLGLSGGNEKIENENKKKVWVDTTEEMERNA
jgi:hypothetical protein